ncbi:MAG TPA: zinc-dependent metalloprotease family protein, partial [Steroidobacteraceae bacterium]|nr:zinc-dependent metalloprotease family protein [Steroidobacteraceae bacterium]
SLEAAGIEVALPDGRVLLARRKHLDRTGTSATWTGEIADAPGSRVAITSHRATVTGTVSLDGRTFEILPGLRGHLVLEEVDPASLPPPEPQLPVTAELTTQAGIDERVYGLPGADVAPVMHDILILYTAASARRRGAPTLESMIVGGVAAANAAYRDSGVGITLRVVGLQQAATITEAPGGMVDTLARLKASREAAALRDGLGADIVLLVNESDDWCGWAYVMYRPLRSYASDAYAAVQSRCISSESIAHEVGHVQGLMHDRESMRDDGALPYGHGYRLCRRDGFRDVMAYPCPGIDVPRLRLFSNPDRQYRGRPTGIAYESDPSRSADAARALNDTAAIVAGYRDGGAAGTPMAPSGLVASGRRGVARLTWSDMATDESGFAIDRSEGGDYVEIARLGPGVTRFVDSSVIPRRTYSYRVRAVGHDGSSRASNVAVVTVANGLPSRHADLRKYSSSTGMRRARD